MPEEQDFDNESPFVGEETNDLDSEMGLSFPEDVALENKMECPYCCQPLTIGTDGCYQHEFGPCQAFFENKEEVAVAAEKIVQQRLKKEEQQRAAAEEERKKMEEQKQAALGEYYDQIINAVQETLRGEIQNSVSVIQRAAEDLYNAKDIMLTATTEVTRSSISEKISYYQTKAAETNEGDPALDLYKDLEDRYNKFLSVYDTLENNKKLLKQKIKELTDINIWSGAGNLEDYQNLLQMIEKVYQKK